MTNDATPARKDNCEHVNQISLQSNNRFPTEQPLTTVRESANADPSIQQIVQKPQNNPEYSDTSLKNLIQSMKITTIRKLLLASLILPASPSWAQNWWSIDDAQFIQQYGSQATGTQAQQSAFAWMLFSRINQQVVYAGDQKKYSQWELWPSDPDTFAPNVAAFRPETKIRTRLHLQKPAKTAAAHAQSPDTNPNPGRAGEEVTRNMISYTYITNQGLNTPSGVGTFLKNPNNQANFPLGAVEIKAYWMKGSLPGAYQVFGYSLAGIHIMAKVKPTPPNPFTDTSPSWFWTTFELKSNPGLANAQKFITYGDALPPGQSGATYLTEAGLGGTPFVNYVSNGQQIQFADASNKAIVLGNTKMEWAFATPSTNDPTKWTMWNSSCHSCHGQTAGRYSETNGVDFFMGFETNGSPWPLGPLTGQNLPPAGYRSFDFVWAIAQNLNN